MRKKSGVKISEHIAMNVKSNYILTISLFVKIVSCFVIRENTAEIF